MKCAIYVRVSTDTEEQKASLENQQRFFYQFLAEKGWDLYKFYIDVESGTKSKKRENFKQLINDAKDKKFDMILAKELSCLARNGKLSYEIKEVVEKNGIHIITFDNAIDSTTGSSHMFGLYAWIYEQESQRTSERIKMAFRTNAQRGFYKASIPPYGYKIVDKKLYLGENGEPAVIKRIFEMYLIGIGFDSIAKTLSYENVPSPSMVAGKKKSSPYWHGSTIRYILTNPHYLGHTVQGRETTASVTVDSRIWLPKEKHIVVKDTHTAIISEHDFELVQDKIFKVKKHIPKAQTHLYTNYLFCKDCSASMWYRSNRTGYICGRYAKHGKKYCSNHAIREEIITEAIVSVIMQAVELIDNKQVRKELQRKNEVTLEHLSAQKHTLSEKIDKSKALKRSFLHLLAEATITSDDYQAETQLIETQLVKWQSELAELSNIMNGLDVEYELSKFQDTYRHFFRDHQLTKKNLPQFISRIEVGEDKVPIITYRFPHLFSLLNQ